MAHGSREPGQAPAELPWAMSHEPVTLNNRLIHELFDYLLYVLCIPLGWFASSARVVCIFHGQPFCGVPLTINPYTATKQKQPYGKNLFGVCKSVFTPHFKLWESQKLRRIICRPLLARGTKAAGLGLVRFLTIRGHAFQLSGYAFMSLESPNTQNICPTKYPTHFPLYH